MSGENKEKKNAKNPLLAVILSALLPGLGQIYNAQVGKGLFFIGFNMIINFLIREPLLAVLDDPKSVDQPTMIVFVGYSLAGLALWIYSIMDAKKNADRINEEANKTTNM